MRKWESGARSLANGHVSPQANALQRPSTPVAKVNGESGNAKVAGEEESDDEVSNAKVTEGERDNSSAALASVRLPPSSYQPSMAALDSTAYSPPRRRHRRQISSVNYDNHYIIGDRDSR